MAAVVIDPVQTAAWANTIIEWAIAGLDNVPNFIIPGGVKTAMRGWLMTIQGFVNSPGWAKEIARLNQEASSQ
jgi:hypothetical protein